MGGTSGKKILTAFLLFATVGLGTAAIVIGIRLGESDTTAPKESEAAVIDALTQDPDNTGEEVRDYGTFVFANGSLKNNILYIELDYDSDGDGESDGKGFEVIEKTQISIYKIIETPLKEGNYILKVYKGAENNLVYDQPFKIYNTNLVAFLNLAKEEGEGTNIVHYVWGYDLLPQVKIYNFTPEKIIINGGTLAEYYENIEMERYQYYNALFSSYTDIRFSIYDAEGTLLEKVENANSGRQHLMYFVLGDAADNNTLVTAVTLNLPLEYKVPEVTPKTDNSVVDKWCAGNWYCENLQSKCYNCGYACEVDETKCPDENALGGAGNFPKPGTTSTYQESGSAD